MRNLIRRPIKRIRKAYCLQQTGTWNRKSIIIVQYMHCQSLKHMTVLSQSRYNFNVEYLNSKQVCAWRIYGDEVRVPGKTMPISTMPLKWTMQASGQAK